MDGGAREALLNQYYHPYRNRMEQWIGQAIRRQPPVLHVAVHTFTPCLNGPNPSSGPGPALRPGARTERRWAAHWQQELKSRRPDLKIRRNYPYLGKSDGLTTALRRRFPAGQYLGLELEVNQSWLGQPPAQWRQLSSDITESLSTAPFVHRRLLEAV